MQIKLIEILKLYSSSL